MKFNLLNEKKLQIIISSKDLSARDLKKWDLVPYNPNAQRLFQEILDHANEACGFEVMRDTQLMVEAYPISGESMIMTITKIGSLPEDHQEPRPSSKASVSDHPFEEFMTMLENKKYAIYEVLNIEDAIDLAHRLPAPEMVPSSLYKGRKGSYYLLIPEVDLLGDQSLGLIFEYSHPTPYSPAFLEEHTDLIIPEDALRHLSLI